MRNEPPHFLSPPSPPLPPSALLTSSLSSPLASPLSTILSVLGSLQLPSAPNGLTASPLPSHFPSILPSPLLKTLVFSPLPSFPFTALCIRHYLASPSLQLLPPNNVTPIPAPFTHLPCTPRPTLSPLSLTSLHISLPHGILSHIPQAGV